jgi:dipeptidase E
VKGRLLLTSGGYMDGQRGDALDKLIEELAGGKSVLFVDNATTTGSNQKAYANVSFNFNKLGCNVDVITLDASNLEKIFEYDVIYITGGDCAPLIELVNSSDFNEQIFEFLKNGGVVIGESAGSLIFCEDLKYYYDVKKGTKPKYDVVLDSYKGVGVISECLYPHWDKDKRKEIVESYFENSDLVFTPLCDGEWIEVDLNKLENNKNSVLTKHKR